MSRTRKKYANCLNCNYRFLEVNSFCAKCGQKNQDIKISAPHFIEEFLEGIFHFDNNLWKTLKYLFASPGKITKDYLDGKRSSLVPPIRLFIFLGLIYYIALTFTKIDYSKTEFDFQNRYFSLNFREKDSAVESKISNTGINKNGVKFKGKSTVIENAPFFIKVKQKISENLKKSSKQQIYSVFIKSFTYVFYLLFPVLAFFIKVFFWKRFYSESIITSLHTHCILFLGIVVFNVGVLFTESYWFDFFIYFGLNIYFIISLKTIYQNSWGLTILKGSMISVFYMTILVFLTLFSILWSVYSL